MPNSEGAPVVLQAHDLAGMAFEYLGSGSATEPLFVNDRPFPLEFLISAAVRGGFQLPCARYDFDFRIGPDSCIDPADDATGQNDTCETALDLSPGIHAGHLVSILDPDYYRVDIPALSTFRVDFFDSGLSSGTHVILRDVCGHALLFANGFGLEWENVSPTPISAILEIRIPSVGNYQNHCAPYSMRVAGGDPGAGRGPGHALPRREHRPHQRAGRFRERGIIHENTRCHPCP